MKPRNQNLASLLTLLFMIGFLGELDYQVIPPLLPLLAKDFDVDPGYGARAVTVYSLSSAFFSLLFGYLSDRHGRRPFIVLGLLCFSVAAFCTSYVGSVESFFLLRFVSGMATGAIVPSVTSLAADSFHYDRRGRAMGVLSMPYFIAAIIGIPVAAIVASTRGWRPIFLAFSISALGCGMGIYLSLRKTTPGISRVSGSRKRFGFEHLESVWKRVIKRQDTLSVLLASTLSSSAIVGFITYLGSYLSAQHHLSVKQVGFVYLFCGLASVVGAPLSGFIADKWAKRPLLILSGVVLAFCFLITPKLPANFWLFIVLGLSGLSIAFRIAPFLAITTELVLPEERATVLALRTTLSQLGIAATTFIASHAFLYKGFLLVGLLVAVELFASSLLVLFFVNEPAASSATGKMTRL